MSAFIVKLLELQSAFELVSEEAKQEYINNVKESVRKYHVPKHTQEELKKLGAESKSWEDPKNHQMLRDKYYYKTLDASDKEIIFYSYILTREWKEVH